MTRAGYQKEYSLKNREKRREHNRAWSVSHKSQRRARHLWVKYKITPEQWDQMLAAQGGRCLCGAEEPGGRHNVWQLDHDHNKLAGEGNRGLLCYACNTTVGTSKESPTRLRLLADYLERNQ